MANNRLKLKLVSDKEIINLRFVKADKLKLNMGEFIDTGGTKNYNNLINKPSLNGTELIGNYDEIDPTVPDWAKEDNKPTYTPEEVGSVDINNEMPISEVKDIWDTYFKGV